MSVTTHYHSFDSKKADKIWEGFNELANNIEKDMEKYDALEKETYETEGRLGKELDKNIMDKYTQGEFSPDVEQRRADEKEGEEKIKQELKPLRTEIEKIQDKNPLLDLDLGYQIAKQIPFEDNEFLVEIMIQADLKFGGKSTRHNEGDAMWAIGILVALFPELEISREIPTSEDMPVDKWVYVFDHVDEIPERLEKNKTAVIDFLATMGSPTESEKSIKEGLSWSLETVRDFLELTKPVIEESKNENTRFLVGFDTNPWDDVELKERAKKHVEEIKSHLKVKNLL